jgi:thioredoxin-like negative regulator of GroEL
MDTISEDGRRQLRVPVVAPKMPTHEGANSVIPVHSISEFLNLVENTERNELVVVKFHAKWCKVCARVIIKFKKMADQLLKTKTPVPMRFVSVQVTDNPQLCSTLDVKKFPFIQIYRNKECVAAFGTGPAHNFQKVVGDTLKNKLECTDDEWNAFRAEFKDVIAKNLEKLEMLRLESAIETGLTNSDSNLSP